MRFDFWNNPLVVTAMRLKYRRSSPGVWAVLWLLALLGVGGILHHTSQSQGFRFPAAYLIAIVGVQTALSAVLAVIAVGSSMNAEVVNRTLDFQRIVTLSPRAILVGKMIGEPAMSYLLTVATLPLAVLCWGLGAASGGVIFWLYVNIVTSTLMWASLGLVNSLTPPTQTGGRQKSGGRRCGRHRRVLRRRAAVGDSWREHDRRAGRRRRGEHADARRTADPPVARQRVELERGVVGAELAVAARGAGGAACRGGVDRIGDDAALEVPARSAGEQAAGVPHLAALDLLIAGVCYAGWLTGYDATKLVYSYGIAHLAATLVMTAFIVPKRQALISWLWRGGHRRPWAWERLTADRAEISGAAVMFALVGVAVLLAAGWSGRWNWPAPAGAGRSRRGSLPRSPRRCS